MAVNKVVYGTTVLVDLTTDTVTADTLKEGVTAHNSAGELITGTMPTATQATPSISVNSSGLITASSTQSEGYVEAGTKSATKQLTVQAAKTITPSTSSQTAVVSGRYTTGVITVAPIPEDYVKPTAIKGATTYTPNTSNQTIASGTYLSGTQTIKGDTNLVADNIKSGVSIFGVTGTYEGSGGGGSVEICTVNLLAPTTLSAISYNTFVNGQFVVRYMTLEDDIGWDNWNVTLDNFVKGTCLTMTWSDSVESIITSGAVQVIGRIASQSTSDCFYLVTINGDCSIDMW